MLQIFGEQVENVGILLPIDYYSFFEELMWILSCAFQKIVDFTLLAFFSADLPRVLNYLDRCWCVLVSPYFAQIYGTSPRLQLNNIKYSLYDLVRGQSCRLLFHAHLKYKSLSRVICPRLPRSCAISISARPTTNRGFFNCFWWSDLNWLSRMFGVTCSGVTITKFSTNL